MRRVFVLFVIGALLLGATLFLRGTASAAEPQVGTTDETAVLGANGTAQLFTHNMAAPGLGAWTIDVAYDPHVITITGCLPISQTSVCNISYASGKIRSAGANAQGLAGSPILTEIQFRCAGTAGSTKLEVMPHDISDATIGGPQLLSVSISNGTVNCVPGSTPSAPTATPMPGVPHAGGGPGVPDGSKLAAALIAMLVAGLATFGAAARAFPRRND